MGNTSIFRQFNLRQWVLHPIALAIAAALLISTIDSLHKVITLAADHWRHPILYHDSLYILGNSNQEKTINWLLKQHNEHRLPITKLFNLLETSSGLAAGQASLFAGLLALLTAMSLWLRLCTSTAKESITCTLGSLSGWLILLNPWQYENLIWEFQLPWLLINVIVLYGSVLLAEHKSDQTKTNHIEFALAATLPWLALAISGQGLAFLLCFSACCLLACTQLGIVVSISSIAAAAANFVFIPYLKPTHHPAINFDIDFYLQVLLGGPWQGLALFTICASLIFLWINCNQIKLSEYSAMILPGLFAVVFSGMITLSRSGFGLQQADASRYITHSLLLGLSAILILLNTINPKPQNRTTRTSLIGLFVLVSTVGSFPQRFYRPAGNYSATWSLAFQATEERRKNFTCHAEQAAMRAEGVKLINQCTELHPHQHKLIRNYLRNKMGTPPQGWHQQLADLRVVTRDKTRIKGLKYYLDSQLITRNTINLRGWTFTANQRSELSPHNSFLIAYYNGKPRLAYRVDSPRPDVGSKWQRSSDDTGFNATFPKFLSKEPITWVELIGPQNRVKIWDHSSIDD